ncbi:MAG: protease inhibitor I42 family protein [Candidatus Saganbacteria bacterium]|nr:protease inhibitor I42 family protein [Candidatus Saganbacteria bacterium]
MNKFVITIYSVFLITMACILTSPGLAGVHQITEEINVKAGETFTFTLDSNPTTGFSWQVAPPLDRNYLRLMGSVFHRPDTTLTGAPGKETWTFKAVKKGNAFIKMIYARSWEKNVPPAAIRTCKIKII